MATLAELRATIEDDLIATPIAVTNTQVDGAIRSAIRHYEGQRFWFNDSREIVFSGIVGENDYSSPDDIGLIERADYIVIELTSGQKRWLSYVKPHTLSWMIDADVADSEPYMWTWFGNGIRLYPAPNDTYTFRVIGFIKYPPLTQDTDTNPWIVEGQGYDLIRARAKWILANDITKDQNEMVRAAAAEEVALTAALNKTGNRYGRGQVSPRQF